MPRSFYIVDSVVDPGCPAEVYAAARVDDFAADFRDPKPEDFEKLDRDGFLRVEGALSPDRIQTMKDALSYLVENGIEDDGRAELAFEAKTEADLEQVTGDERLDACRKLMNFVQQHPDLQAMSVDDDLLSWVQQGLGGVPQLFQDMALFKPPHIGREKPWHQDQAYFNLPEETKVIGIWIALDDADLDNGCMHFIAGRHKEGAVPHFNVRDWQICDDYPLENPIVAAPVKAGDMLIFDSMTPHGTPTNHSGKRRRSLQFHYCSTETEILPDSEERIRIFGGDGQGLTC